MSDTEGPDVQVEPKQRRYRRPLGRPIVESLLILCLLAAAGLALTAVPAIESIDPFEALGLFYRRHLVGVLPGDRVLPIGFLMLGIAAILLLLTFWPRLRPELRGATAAYAMCLMIIPVLVYRPQVEVLGMHPDDLPILTADLAPEVQARVHPDRFDPVLPITWPLAAAAALALVWMLVTPAAVWPPAFKAFGMVSLLFVGGGFWLWRMLLAARGNALQLDLMQWPYSAASLWSLAQLGVAATASAAVSGPITSRVLSGGLAVLLIVTAILAGGLR